MTETLPRLDEPGDAELISAVRGGDVSAYGGLFERHVGAARRLARQLVGPADADDLVSDAYVKVLRVLQNGGGPDIAFRAYLLTAIRRLHVDKMRAGARLHSTDDMEAFDPGVPFRDTAVEGFENAAAAKAFASLPERWQLVLWHTEVEGQKPAEVAALLGISPNSVSALAYRAREGLRQAFLNSHAAEIDDAACSWTHEHLGAYIRNGVSKRDASKVEKHLDECRKCMAIYLELTEVNSNLGGILAPLLLGGAGLGYLGGAGGVAAKGGLVAMFDRARDAVVSNGQAAAVAGVAAATVIAAATIAMIAGGGDDADPAAKSPTSSTTSSTAPSDSPVLPAQPPAPAPKSPMTPAPARSAAPPAVTAPLEPTDEPASGPDVENAASSDEQSGDDPGTAGAGGQTGGQAGGGGNGNPGQGGTTNRAPARNPNAPTSLTVAAGGSTELDANRYAVDADGDPLVFTAATVDDGTVTFGRATAARTTFQGSSRFITYTAPAESDGSDTIAYTISDGEGNLRGQVTVTITTTDPPTNRAPVPADDRATTTSGVAISIAVLTNDEDPDGDALEIVDHDNVSQQGGTVTQAGRSLVYTSASGFVGIDSFAYTVSDGNGGMATATVSVDVTARTYDVGVSLDVEARGLNYRVRMSANGLPPSGRAVLTLRWNIDDPLVTQVPDGCGFDDEAQEVSCAVTADGAGAVEVPEFMVIPRGPIELIPSFTATITGMDFPEEGPRPNSDTWTGLVRVGLNLGSGGRS